MRDPLLAENPFLKDYTDCEKWCYANAVVYNDPLVEELFAGDHPGWQALEVGVSSQGWLVPVLESYHTTLENSLGYYDRYGDDDGCAATLLAIGPMEDELKQALLEKLAEERAPYLLPVPGWLADAPPRVVRFIPDGNFAVCGELGSGTGLDNAWLWNYAPPPTDDEPWSLYSPEGELIRTGEPGEYWWQLYFTDFEEVTGYAADTEEIKLYDWGGTVTGYNSETYDTSFNYTYTGESLDGSGTDRPEIDPRSLAMLCGPEIPLIRAAQQHVTPRQPCGLGIGVTDPGELDQQLPIAIGISPATGAPRYISVGSPDDPANPYTGLYKDYDRWFYDNHLRLCQTLDFNSLLQADPWAANDAVKDRVMAQSSPGTSFSNFYLMIDDSGWLVPYHLQLELESKWLIPGITPLASELGDNLYMSFQLASCGNMRDAIFDAYQAAPFTFRAGYLPEVPAWLADDPPVSIRFLPDGGFISEGEPGSLAMGTWDVPWLLYDAAGKELNRVPAGSEWWELTFPDYNLVKQSLGNPEFVSASEFGGIIWFSTIDDGIYSELATYNYKGREVTNPDPDRFALYFETYPGDYLARMRAAQTE